MPVAFDPYAQRRVDEKARDPNYKSNYFGIPALGKAISGLTKDPTADAKRKALTQQGQAASDFAGFGERGYGAMTDEAAAMREALRRRISGEGSMVNEQLRQGLQQQLAQQRSMAASASPANSAMAARNAAINMGRASSAMGGQAALARLQEQKDAESALAAAIYGQRGQDLQAALGSRGNAISAYGGVQPQGSFLDRWAAPISSALGSAGQLFRGGGGGAPASMPTGTDGLNSSWRRGLGG